MELRGEKCLRPKRYHNTYQVKHPWTLEVKTFDRYHDDDGDGDGDGDGDDDDEEEDDDDDDDDDDEHDGRTVQKWAKRAIGCSLCMYCMRGQER